MDVTENMSGKYWKTCSKDITSSEGWFKKIMLLGLLSFVPVFGAMTLNGYAYEWAHKAAWGVRGPLPKKIYGRTGSKMLRWGWFAFALGIIISLIPGIISAIGTALFDGGLGVSVWDYGYYAHHAGYSAGSGILLAVGGLLIVVGMLASFVACVVTWVSCMRMTVYDKFGAGMQLGKVFKMIGHDFGGIARIFGMYLLTSLVIGIIYAVAVGIIVFVVVLLMLGFGLSTGAAYGGSGMGGAQVTALVVQMVLMALLVAFPLVLVVVYALFVMNAWQTLLIARAVGYWTAQFDIAHWGRKEDPMPFEVDPSAGAASTPQAPQTATAGAPAAQGVSLPAEARPTPEGEAGAPDVSDAAATPGTAAGSAPEDGAGK